MSKLTPSLLGIYLKVLSVWMPVVHGCAIGYSTHCLSSVLRSHIIHHVMSWISSLGANLLRVALEVCIYIYVRITGDVLSMLYIGSDSFGCVSEGCFQCSSLGLAALGVSQGCHLHL